jgi:hypothetical protein
MCQKSNWYSYLCVRNLTGIQVSTAFWEGVALLHRFGFNIVASICDGASEKRNFINASVQLHPNFPNSSHIGLNPFTNGPIYFISGPPHLTKKTT